MALKGMKQDKGNNARTTPYSKSLRAFDFLRLLFFPRPDISSTRLPIPSNNYPRRTDWVLNNLYDDRRGLPADSIAARQETFSVTPPRGSCNAKISKFQVGLNKVEGGRNHVFSR